MSDEVIVITDDIGEVIVDDQVITPGIAPVKNDQMVPKSRLDQVIQQKKDLLTSLQSVAKELIEDIPESFRMLVPELEPAAQISWIRKAQKSGIFIEKVVDGLDTKRPDGKKSVDTTGMTPMQMIAQGYNKK